LDRGNTPKKKVSKKDSKIRIYKSYDELDISDDFMFSKIMRDPVHCKPMLETIIGKEIARIEYPETQKTIDLAADAKSVRLDVYCTDDEYTVYQIEMQVRGTSDIPKRMRYGQGMIDLNLIEKGQTYSDLNKTIIIFICKEDIFKKNRCIVTVMSDDDLEPLRKWHKIAAKANSIEGFIERSGITD
jgi:predicted transposase/invertase (TIGR01784 family)